MTTDEKTRTGFSLRRWSARKRAAAQAPGASEAEPQEQGAAAAGPEAAPAPPVSSAGEAAVPPTPSDLAAAHAARMPAAAAPAPAVSLPPVESLTPQSDFTPFMRPDVDPAVKRAALRKLFADPHFNVMDGLDVYIDDYSKPDPIAPEILKTLVQARYVFNPPLTRVNAQGFVEDVPPDEADAERRAAAQTGAADRGVAADASGTPGTAPHDRAAGAVASPGSPRPDHPADGGGNPAATPDCVGTASPTPDAAQLELPLPKPRPSARQERE